MMILRVAALSEAAADVCRSAATSRRVLPSEGKEQYSGSDSHSLLMRRDCISAAVKIAGAEDEEGPASRGADKRLEERFKELLLLLLLLVSPIIEDAKCRHHFAAAACCAARFS